VLLPAAASANCGLSFCPFTSHSQEPSPAEWNVSVQVQQSGFDFDGVTGSYTQVLPRIEYRGKQGVILGASLPVTRLSSGGESHTGLSNALVFGETQLDSWSDWKPSAGLQAELPVGDHEHGLAADHTMLVPYLTLARSLSGADF